MRCGLGHSVINIALYILRQILIFRQWRQSRPHFSEEGVDLYLPSAKRGAEIRFRTLLHAIFSASVVSTRKALWGMGGDTPLLGDRRPRGRRFVAVGRVPPEFTKRHPNTETRRIAVCSISRFLLLPPVFDFRIDALPVSLLLMRRFL